MQATWATGVPVTIDGIEVGKADIKSDGVVTMVISKENDHARRIIELIRHGLCEGLSLQPNMLQAQQAVTWRGNPNK